MQFKLACTRYLVPPQARSGGVEQRKVLLADIHGIWRAKIDQNTANTADS